MDQEPSAHPWVITQERLLLLDCPRPQQPRRRHKGTGNSIITLSCNNSTRVELRQVRPSSWHQLQPRPPLRVCLGNNFCAIPCYTLLCTCSKCICSLLSAQYISFISFYILRFYSMVLILGQVRVRGWECRKKPKYLGMKSLLSFVRDMWANNV